MISLLIANYFHVNTNSKIDIKNGTNIHIEEKMYVVVECLFPLSSYKKLREHLRGRSIPWNFFIFHAVVHEKYL